jgi:hypothetical protein
MSLGKIFFLVAAVLLLLAGLGTTVIANPMIWALFCIALGLLLGERPVGLARGRWW